MKDMKLGCSASIPTLKILLLVMLNVMTENKEVSNILKTSLTRTRPCIQFYEHHSPGLSMFPLSIRTTHGSLTALTIGHLHVGSISKPWDIGILAVKSTTQTRETSEQMTKRDSSPEVSTSLAPVERYRKRLPHFAKDMHGYRHQHAHHDMEPQEVGKHGLTHYENISTYEVHEEDPDRESA